jgi:hypothetical protein
MLENFHLKSRFYPVQVEIPESDQINSPKILLESRKITKTPKPCIKLSNSYKNHQPRQDLQHSIPTNITNADESFKEIKKLVEKRSSKQPNRSFLNDSLLTDSVKKPSCSTGRRSVKRSEKIAHGRPSSRLKTPYFRKIQYNDPETLQALCESLLVEQEVMKNTIKKQEKLLLKLDVLDSTPKNKPSLPKIFRFDFSTIANLKRGKEKGFRNLRINSPLEYISKTSLNSPTGALQDHENFSSIKPEDLSMSRLSTKFHKDQPKLCSSLRFPMEIFTPK